MGALEPGSGGAAREQPSDVNLTSLRDAIATIDGVQPDQGALPDGGSQSPAFAAELVDERHHNHAIQHRDAKERDEAYAGTHRERHAAQGEREVQLGPSSGNEVDVISGVMPRDTAVVDGSSSVRAARNRLGLQRAAPSASVGSTRTQSFATATPGIQEAKVLVTEKGYQPAKLTLRAGTPARITFIRTTDKTCATEVVFSLLNIRRALPLNQSVAIEVTPRARGEVNFVCGMNMLRCTVIVE